MKIIMIDNFNRDSVSDVLICENMHPKFAFIIKDLLDKNYTDKDWFFKLVENDYKLHIDSRL